MHDGQMILSIQPKINMFDGFLPMTWEGMFELFDKSNVFFGERRRLEVDETFQQLIPYVLVVDAEHNVLTYRRSKQAGEQRLHGLRALGFGGHVDLQDASKPSFHLPTTLHNAVGRELKEELGISRAWTFDWRGMVCTHKTPVDRVHLGLVAVVEVRTNAPRAVDPEISDLQWVDQDDLVDDDSWESWSSLLITALKEGSLKL